MTTLIFGKGFVGKATAAVVQGDIAWHDPAQGYDQADLRTVDRAIICVPTPLGSDGLDHTAVVDSLVLLYSSGWSGPVAVRSTCMPTAFDSMMSVCKNLVYWPEFLREANAAHDAANPTQVVLGGRHTDTYAWKLWLNSRGHAQQAVWTLTDICSASLIKLGTNAALAAKIMMFNSLYTATHAVNGNWATVRAGVGIDPRIGTGQSSVPGPDGSPGFGGKCLPKDLSALSNMIPDDLFLQGLISQNNSIRNNNTR